MSHLDGNVLAGPLSEVFREDMTTAKGECASCHDRSVLALAIVFDIGPGWTVRCHACEAEIMTLVRIPTGFRIDLRGLASLEAPVAGAES